MLLPALYTWSEVSSKIIGGADLFLQGVLVPEGGLEPFLMGSARSICVPGNPIPFAVGTMAVSSAEAKKEGMKGRGLTLLHSWGDLLWALGPKIPPNEGFTATRIYPLAAAIQGEGSNGGEAGGEGEASATLGEVNNEGSTRRGENNDNKEESMGDEVATAGQGLEGLSLVNGTPDADSIDNNTNNLSTAGTAGGSSISGVEMDLLLEAAVLGGLQSLKTAELPIQTSDFYQRHMLPLRPEGVTFDFKASTKYKKLSKLLDKFEKDKVLTQKQIRKQDHISAINRSHKLITEWSGMPAVHASSAAGGAKGNAAGGQRGVLLELLYRAPSSLRAVFGPEGLANKDALYSESAVAAALTSYATRQQLLASQDASSIKLDHLLASGLWGKKEGPEEGSVVPTKELLQRFLTKLQLWYRIERPQEGGMVLEVVRKGAVRAITVLAEKRNGRNVTAVARVEGFGFAADDLAADFQRRFKTACSVSKLPGKMETDYEIMLQGDLANKVVAYFCETEGIEAKYIEVNNKLSGKKKK